MRAGCRTGQVFACETLDEARQIVALQARGGARQRLLAGLARGYSLLGNLLLGVLGRILFRRGGGAPGRICVYMVGIFGDTVVLLPALAALRTAYPAARIDVVTNHQHWDGSAAREILASSRLVDGHVLIDDDPVVRRGFAFVLDLRLEALGCDLFVNLSPFGNRGLLGAVAREMIFAKMLGARRAVGFRVATWSRGRLFDKVQERLVQNEPRRGRAVLAELGLTPREGEDLFPADEAARERVRELLSRQGADPDRFAVLNPGAKFTAKRWQPERFAEIGRRLAAEFGYSLVITGTPEERETAQEVARGIGAGAVNLAGKTGIRELMEVLRLAQCCVTNDTGTMHLAAMAGVPTAAIFSSRHTPLHWLPLGGPVISLFSLPACRDCYDDECTSGECLALITVEHVWRALQRALGLRKAQR